MPWALWPNQGALFGAAWRRFFLGQQVEDWQNTPVVRSFLAEPEAIDVVRESLAPVSSEKWQALRQALIRQAGQVTWLSEGQRQTLDRALG